VTRSAVIQVKPGIGDVVWHLPFIRAIAARSPGGKVTFLAPPSSGAKELLAIEPGIAETIYFEHAGSELRRGINLIRLVALLRRCRFRTLWILDRTTRPAVAAMLAGIPERIGLGLGAQRLFITNPGIDHSHFHDHPIDWLRALMAAEVVPLPSTEPELRVPSDLLATIGESFSGRLRPWIVLGIGASFPDKDWPDESWAELLAGLRRRTAGTIFLIGGAKNTARAQMLIAQSAGTPAINACNLKLAEALALLRHADLFMGTDSGPMNLAAAVATPAFGLFGVTQVLGYSKYIRPIVPAGGPAPGGMRRISPAQVLERVEPHLLDRKEQGIT
jgi:heptosyltransferase-2